jgi:hypothetical protein
MSLQIEAGRIHSRAPVHAVTLAWWRKSGDDFRAAMQERNRSKIGRMARLRGQVETAVVVPPALPVTDKIKATVAAMRRSGAPESDIEEFLKSQGS